MMHAKKFFYRNSQLFPVFKLRGNPVLHRKYNLKANILGILGQFCHFRTKFKILGFLGILG